MWCLWPHDVLCVPRPALKNIFMLEFHPTLAIASRIPQALKHANWVSTTLFASPPHPTTLFIQAYYGILHLTVPLFLTSALPIYFS